MTGEWVLSRPPKLLERHRELAEIDACIAAAAAGQGAFLVLEGRAGMGKSALLAEVQRRAAAVGLATYSAVGSELEGGFAFGVVRQLFEPAIRNLRKADRARVFEGAAALAAVALGAAGETAASDPFAALHGLYWLAANLAARRPLLLSVDDAHWADAASLRWLAYLLNRLDGLPVLVATAMRPRQGSRDGEVLASITAQPPVRILSVGPLGEGSVATLVRATLGADPDPIFTAGCLRATAGNALGLTELLRELQAKGVEPTSISAADLEVRAPDAIARRVQRDLGLLGEDAKRLARAMAVIGDGTEFRLTARLAELEGDRAADAADDLLVADILASERPPRFAHPLLRAAVYDHLPAGLRQRLHRRASELLRSEGADPEAVAAHLLRCNAGRSAETIERLTAAAPLALRRGAPEAAVSYLRRAVVEDAGAPQRTVVLAELGRAEVASGDPAAIDHLRAALSGTTDRQSRAAILCDLAAAVMLQGNEGASRDLIRRALDEVRDCDEEAATRLQCFVMGFSSGDPRVESSADPRFSQPDIHYPSLWRLARSGGTNAELARATLAFLLSWCDGNREEALSCIGSGFGWNSLFNGRDLSFQGVVWSMCALLGIDDPRRAAGWCATVIRGATAEGYPLGVMTGLALKSLAELHLGQLAEAEADATAAMEISQYFPFYTPTASSVLAVILFERGRQHAGYKAIEEVSLAGSPGGGVEAAVRVVRGRLRHLRGWRERAVDDLREAGRLCELHRLRNQILYPWRASLALALAEDSIDEARSWRRRTSPTPAVPAPGGRSEPPFAHVLG